MTTIDHERKERLVQDHPLLQAPHRGARLISPRWPASRGGPTRLLQRAAEMRVPACRRADVARRPAARRDAGELAARRPRQDVRRSAARPRGDVARRRGRDRPVRQRAGGCRRLAARCPAGTEPVRRVPTAGAPQPADRRVPRHGARRRRPRHPQLDRRRSAAERSTSSRRGGCARASAATASPTCCRCPPVRRRAWFGILTYWYERIGNTSQGWLDKVKERDEDELTVSVHVIAADAPRTVLGLPATTGRWSGRCGPTTCPAASS